MHGYFSLVLSWLTQPINVLVSGWGSHFAFGWTARSQNFLKAVFRVAHCSVTRNCSSLFRDIGWYLLIFNLLFSSGVHDISVGTKVRFSRFYYVQPRHTLSPWLVFIILVFTDVDVARSVFSTCGLENFFKQDWEDRKQLCWHWGHK